MKRYSVSLPIESECGKIRTRINLNTDTFYSVNSSIIDVWQMLKFYVSKSLLILEFGTEIELPMIFPSSVIVS